MPKTIHNDATYASPAHAKQVEASLSALQDKHRLAIHQWESDKEPLIYPGYLTTLHADAALIPEALQNGSTLAEYSMTLLPSSRSGRSVKPYEVFPDEIAAPGYLFDLDQSHPHPAKVIRASTENLESSHNIFNKNLWLHAPTILDPDSLASYYQQFPDDTALRKKVGADQAATEQQLDMLGQELEKERLSKHYLYRNSRSILPHNEILVAATDQHIRAISIPMYEHVGNPEHDFVPEHDKMNYGALEPDERQAILELTGASYGLQHLNRGIDLPVVFYHVNGSEQNKVTFFAQGREALTEKAMGALKILEQHNTLKRFDPYYAKQMSPLIALVKDVLAIDPLQLTASTDVRANSAEHHGRGLGNSHDHKINSPDSAVRG